jgi:hypothetical protein
MKKQPALYDTNVQNALLGDLETIRALLDVPSLTDDAEDVPMLEDMVGGGYSVNETRLTGSGSLGTGGGVSALADETIEALLGDEWRERADQILAGVRVSVDDIASADALAREFDERLRRRIARTLDDWLAEIVQIRIDLLRTRMLELLDLELKRFIDTSK